MAAPVGMIAKTAGGIGAAGAVSTAATLGVIYANSEGETKPNTPAEKILLEKIEEKITALGLTGCQKDNGDKSKTCTVNKDKLKDLIFVDKTNGEAVTSEGGNVKLKIEMTEEDTDVFTDKFKFTIKNENDAEVKIKKGATDVHTLKKGIEHEFKTKDTNKLEKAWNAKTLGEKAGLECVNEGSDIKCSLKTNKKINVVEGANKLIGATVTNESTSTKKISTSANKDGYNQGFEFNVSADINLTAPSGVTSSITKLANGNKYEVKKEAEGWSLVKKNSN